MTSSQDELRQDRPVISPDHLPSAFRRAVMRARAAEFWERLWPRVIPPAVVTGLGLSASFAGVWDMVSPTGRLTGVMAFTLALAASVARPPVAFRTGSLNVTWDDGLRRLDRNIGSPDQPARFIGGRPAEGSSDIQKALWSRDASRTWAQYESQFRAGMPHPNVSARDPYHLRFFTALTLAVTAALSPAPHLDQVKKAFDWTAELPPPVPLSPLQLKAWVTPPEGIQRESLHMSEATRDHLHGGERMQAHEGSTLTIMTYSSGARIHHNGKVLPLQKEIPQGQGKTGYQYETKLGTGENRIVIERGPQWQISVAPDLPPAVSIRDISPLKGEERRSLGMTFKAHDDNGYTGEIVIESGADDHSLPSAKAPAFNIP